MLRGNKEFTLVDDQKVAFETALSHAARAMLAKKEVLVVEGGPGTGKSVVAINLLVEMTNRDLFVQYVTRNSAPRLVYEARLTGSMKKSHISNLFSGSGSYHSLNANSYDCLIVDEAHRLNEKSGMFMNLGENQVGEIIRASKCSVFFIDEDQKVTLKHIGDKPDLRKRCRTSIPFPLLEMRSLANPIYTRIDGYFPDSESITWQHVPGGPFPRDRFLVRAEGDSMAPRIRDGQLCVFRRDAGGSLNGTIVLCRIDGFAGDAPVALLKRYRSARTATADSAGEARSIVLSSANETHDDIVLNRPDRLSIIGVFDRTLD